MSWTTHSPSSYYVIDGQNGNMICGPARSNDNFDISASFLPTLGNVAVASRTIGHNSLSPSVRETIVTPLTTADNVRL
jgi:hypothetical protein